MAVLAGCGYVLLAHDDGLEPHQGNPPLHAQDKMHAFRDDHHEPLDLASASLADCVGGSAMGYPCSNVDLMAFLPLNQIGGGNGNDIWGWTDPLTGKEYAIMGRTSGTSFVDISDPGNPVYLGNLPAHAASSSWRDIKVYANHAFIVSEAIQSGMQVFDLTQLRSVPTPPAAFSETAWYNGFLTAHNLVINEDSGYAYAVGSNTCGGGLHAVDIQDPLNPVPAGCYSGDGYTHDAQCVIYHGPDAGHTGDEVCFNSNEDTLTIVDVSNKAAPVQLSRTGYAGSRYTHQGWLTEDHAYFLTDDELDESTFGHSTRTYVWDLADLESPIMLGFYSAANAAIDHNQYVKGGYVYQANYRSGLRILDLSGIASASLTEAGYFDIYPSSDAAAFNGAWSNYPYFASGVVVVSGIEQGLYILRPRLDSTNAAPEVSIVSPTGGSTVSGNVTVRVSATDAEDASGTLTVQWDISGGPPQGAVYNSASGYYEATWDTTAGSNGGKTLNARATDSSGSQGSASIAVTVSNAPPPVHVGDIQMTTVRAGGPRYQGVATVTMHNAAHLPVGGITVTGSFTGDSSGNASATTGADGKAQLSSPPAKNGSLWTFCVDNATGAGWSYDASANEEICDSTGTAPPTGFIEGSVTDSATSLPIGSATVATDTGQSTATDSGGAYSLNGVPAGTRTVTASASGYTSAQTQAVVGDTTTTVVNFALVASAPGGGSGSIKGVVTDGSGSKVEGALITTDTGQSGATNKGGRYTIQNVPAGVRTVTASKAGYATQQKIVTLAGGQTATVDFTF